MANVPGDVADDCGNLWIDATSKVSSGIVLLSAAQLQAAARYGWSRRAGHDDGDRLGAVRTPQAATAAQLRSLSRLSQAG